MGASSNVHEKRNDTQISVQELTRKQLIRVLISLLVFSDLEFPKCIVDGSQVFVVSFSQEVIFTWKIVDTIPSACLVIDSLPYWKSA